MSLKEAIKIMNEHIPAPGSGITDQRYVKLIWAWYEFSREFKRLESENLITDEKGLEYEQEEDENIYAYHK